jgi:hypothetical protein
MARLLLSFFLLLGCLTLSISMTLRLRLVVLVGLMTLGLAAPSASAHHGPPHDEIDEFDEAVGRFATPKRAMRLSWPALVLSVGGAAVAFALSRRIKVGALETCPARSRG